MSARVVSLCSVAVTSVCGVGPSSGWSRPSDPMGKMYDKFYTDLDSAVECGGLNNREGAAQCFVPEGENGLYLVDSQAAWDAIQSTVSSHSSLSKVIAVIAPSLHVDEAAAILKNGAGQFPYITAVLHGQFIQASVTLASKSGWSPMGVRPGGSADLYGENGPEWNPNGLGLFGQKLPQFLMMELKDLEAASEAAKKNRDEGYAHPVWSAELNYLKKNKNKNALECLRDDSCSLVGRYSLWGVSGPLDAAPKKPVIGVTMPISGLSMYTSYSTPAEGAVIGSLVTALAALDALSPTLQDLKSYLAFMFFDAENFGFAGSARFWKDISDFECIVPAEGKEAESYACMRPRYGHQSFNFSRLTRESFSHVVALDQLGVMEHNGDNTTVPSGGPYLYYDKDMFQNDNTKISAAMDVFARYGASKATEHGEYLPPSALHTLLHDTSQRNRTDLVALTLAGYDGQFVNKAYGSVYDKALLGTQEARLSTPLLANSARALAKSLYELAGGNDTDNVNVNETLVADLVQCFGSSLDCPLIASYIASCQRPKGKANMFPGFFGNSKLNPLVSFIGEFLSDKLALPTSSDATCNLEGLCAKKPNRTCADPQETCVADGSGAQKCRKAAVWYHYADTPAVRPLKSGWVYDDAYSYLEVWTGSPWLSNQGIRLFQRDTVASEVVMLVVGVLLFLVCLAAVFAFRLKVLPKIKAD